MNNHIEAVYNKTGKPPHWEEITEKEFAQSHFFIYTPETYDFRQFPIDDNGPITNVRLWWMHDGKGYAIVNDYWAGTLRFFKFANCLHEYKSLSIKESAEKGIRHFGNCYHVKECVKCGYIWEYDSSG